MPRLFPSCVTAGFLSSEVIRLKIPLNVLDTGAAVNLCYVCLFNHIRSSCIFDSEISVDLCMKINGIRESCLFQELSFRFLTGQLTVSHQTQQFAEQCLASALGSSRPSGNNFWVHWRVLGNTSRNASVPYCCWERIVAGGCDF